MSLKKKILIYSVKLRRYLRNCILAPVDTFCTNYKGKNTKATSDNMLNSKLDLIHDKLDTLTKSFDHKTVNQTVFVKARPGLGYEDGPNTIFVKARPSLGYEDGPNTITSASDKLAKELTQKIDNLD